MGFFPPLLQMTKNRRTVRDNRPLSDDDSEESDEPMVSNGDLSKTRIVAPKPTKA
jgi:hypothetical protein